MGRRKRKWDDDDVGGFKKDKSRQYRGKAGEKHFLRIMTDPEEYILHKVDDVLEPEEDGTPRVFNAICRREWDDDEEDWTGDCQACDEGYETISRYICGVVFLGQKPAKGKGKISRIDPELSPRYWDFGKDKFNSLAAVFSDLQDEDPPRKLNQVEITVTCDEKRDEEYQDLKINTYSGKTLTEKGHLKAWKAQGADLIDAATKADSESEMKRSLARKKKKKSRGSDDDDDNEATSAPTKKRTKKRSKKRAPEPEDDDDEDEDEDPEDEELDELLKELER